MCVAVSMHVYIVRGDGEIGGECVDIYEAGVNKASVYVTNEVDEDVYRGSGVEVAI